MKEKSKKKSKPLQWKCVGDIAVDSGTILFCDPCHIEDEIPEEAFKSFEGINDATQSEVGLIIRTGFGDGVYPVFVQREKGRGIIRVLIELGPPSSGD